MKLGDNFLDTIDGITPEPSSKVKGTGGVSFWFKNLGLRILEPAERIDKLVSLKKIYRILPLLIFVFFLVLARVFNLQIIKGDNYLLTSEENRVRIKIQPAPRGLIVDRTGKVIVRNKPGFSIVFTTTDEERLASKNLSREEEVDALSQILGLTVNEIRDKIDDASLKGLPQATIVSELSRDDAIKLESRILPLNRVSLEISPVREYLDPFAFSHLVGYVSEIDADELKELADIGYYPGDSIGKVGVEGKYESNLHGEAGARVYEVDSSFSSFKILSEVPPKAGGEVRLSTDYDLQVSAYYALRDQVIKSGASGGAVVAQDVSNGEILTLVSVPAFDSNLFAGGISNTDYQNILQDTRQPLFNRVVSGEYPPGSTFKMVTASAALEEGVITPDTKLEAPGSINIGEFVFGDWKPEGHGMVNLREAIGESADTYFYKVGGGYSDQVGVGVDNLYKWSKLFGLGEQTGVDLYSEAQGLVPNEEWKLNVKGESWYTGNTYHFAIGQGDILTTPLQVNNLTTTVANGGILFKPSLLLGEVSSNSNVKTQMSKLGKNIIRKGFVSEETLSAVREGMKLACDPGGTAYPLYDVPGFEVGCKTGTSEFGVATADTTHAWLTLFAPFDNPKIAITVFLEGGGEGSHDAGPVMRKIVDHLIEVNSEYVQ